MSGKVGKNHTHGFQESKYVEPGLERSRTLHLMKEKRFVGRGGVFRGQENGERNRRKVNLSWSTSNLSSLMISEKILICLMIAAHSNCQEVQHANV